MDNNERYLNALLTGDDRVIKEIYVQQFPKIQSYIVSNKGTKDDALDVFHDALLYIIVAYKERNISIKSFEAYLYVVCRNIWKRKLKTKVINSKLDTLENKATDLSLYILEQECFDFYIEKFQLLSSNCKEILGNYFNGWSYEELTESLNYANINTVRQRVFKCRTKLIELIKSDKRYQKLKEWNII